MDGKPGEITLSINYTLSTHTRSVQLCNDLSHNSYEQTYTSSFLKRTLRSSQTMGWQIEAGLYGPLGHADISVLFILYNLFIYAFFLCINTNALIIYLNNCVKYTIQCI